MNSKCLTDYVKKHEHIYAQLANECTSVPELQLKLVIYGKQWTQWDWALFLNYIATPPGTQNTAALYNDIIETLDSSNVLDSVMTNKQVVLALIHCTKSARIAPIIGSYSVTALNNMLAHIFKKFPKLWTISWMWTKTWQKKIGKSLKVHRLSNPMLPNDAAAQRKLFLKQWYIPTDFGKEKNEEEQTIPSIPTSILQWKTLP